ncbi:MAG: hypothetical protein MUF34_38685 [Polyangiaceae bacterium]|nr:hypothetical protein [Polyangiaceae bacterium]
MAGLTHAPSQLEHALVQGRQLAQADAIRFRIARVDVCFAQQAEKPLVFGLGLGQGVGQARVLLGGLVAEGAEVVRALFVAGEHERGGVVITFGRLVQQKGSMAEQPAPGIVARPTKELA